MSCAAPIIPTSRDDGRALPCMQHLVHPSCVRMSLVGRQHKHTGWNMLTSIEALKGVWGSILSYSHTHTCTLLQRSIDSLFDFFLSFFFLLAPRKYKCISSKILLRDIHQTEFHIGRPRPSCPVPGMHPFWNLLPKEIGKFFFSLSLSNCVGLIAESRCQRRSYWMYRFACH